MIDEKKVEEAPIASVAPEVKAEEVAEPKAEVAEGAEVAPEAVAPEVPAE